MARLNRRDFLKALGLAGATTATACGWDDNWYYTPIETILPYVVKPEQVTPGAPTFFATTVTTGPDAWPVTGRHQDGRTIQIGANRQASKAPAIPKAALLELQRVYSPDRLRQPMAGGAAITWEDARGRLVAAVKQAVAEGKKVAWIGPYRSGALASLLDDFTSGNAWHWEPLGRAAEADAHEVLFGVRALPTYAMSEARYVLSFGAPFLGPWGGTGLEADFANAKNPNAGQFIARFGLVSPHMDQTGANADDWYPCAVGAQAAAAFAIARLIADKKGYAGNATAILNGVDVAAAGAASGLTAEQLAEIADRFASAPAAVALPGPIEDVDLAVATFLIHVVSGNVGKTFLPSGYTGKVHGTRHVAELVAAMNAGQIGVLLVDDANPVYSLPSALGFAEALGKVGTVVALSGHPSETNAKAALHLPTASMLEDWGDEDLDASTHLLRQPTMTALWAGLSLGDILLATAREAGLTAPSVAAAAPPPVDPAAPPVPAPAPADPAEVTAPAPLAPLGFEPATFRDYVAGRWQREVYPKSGSSSDFKTFWFQSLKAGGWFGPRQGADLSLVSTTYTFALRAPVSGTGLVLYAHPHRMDGRYAGTSWAQEVADPMTGQVWDSWLEVSPDLAAELGVVDKDEVELKTSAGSVKLGVEVYRGLKGKTAALAFGQGHTDFGRYANNRGVNAYSLLGADQKDSQGNILYAASNVQITKTGARADLVSTFGGDSDGGRWWGLSVNADELAAKGDAPAAHPGDMTPVHHLPRDARLEEKQRFNFYNSPDHSTYRFAMTIDTNACDGCGVCAIACYAENNLPVVGKRVIARGREMNWLRINRYWEKAENGADDVRFVPMLCQHCALAPCESVCPVLATYHNIDGLNAMIYNRCVGTRYCANNCPYVVRRFNFHSFVWPEPLHLQLNPDVSVRTMGVMEKCTFCVQRTRRVKDLYRDRGVTTTVPDEALRQLPACAEACPSQAITFGNLKDPESTPAKSRKSGRSYVIMAEFNTESAINYLAKASFHAPKPHHGGGHGEAHGSAGEAHGDAGHAAPAGTGDGHGEAGHAAPAAHGGGAEHGAPTENHGGAGTGAEHH